MKGLKSLSQLSASHFKRYRGSDLCGPFFGRSTVSQHAVVWDAIFVLNQFCQLLRRLLCGDVALASPMESEIQVVLAEDVACKLIRKRTAHFLLSICLTLACLFHSIVTKLRSSPRRKGRLSCSDVNLPSSTKSKGPEVNTKKNRQTIRPKQRTHLPVSSCHGARFVLDRSVPG